MSLGRIGDQTLDDLVDGHHVECREDQHASFRRRQGDLDSFVIPHFADGDDVAILTQRRPQALAKEFVSLPTSRWRMIEH